MHFFLSGWQKIFWSKISYYWLYGLGLGGGGTSRVEELEPGVFGLFEPEQLVKKIGAGAAQQKKMEAGPGAAKDMRLMYRLLEDKKHKEIVHFLLF